MKPQPEWVSISRYAVLFGVNRRTVYKWLEGGLLVCWRVGRVVRIRKQPPNRELHKTPVKWS